MKRTGAKAKRKRGGPRLQPRDFEIFRGLYESRVMTLRHAADLHFGGSYEAARKRLAALKAAGYVRERTGRVGEPSILLFTPKAYRALGEGEAFAALPRVGWARLARRMEVSPLTLRHELDVVGLKAAFARAVDGREDLELSRFTTWPRLCRFKVPRTHARPGQDPSIRLNPDGFLRLKSGGGGDAPRDLHFFVEVDRSTEALDRLVEKMHAYAEFYRTGKYARRCGAGETDYRQYPFRVLWTFKSPQRLAHAADAFAAATPRLGNMAWMATHAGAEADPLAAVWHAGANPDPQALVPAAAN